MERRHRRRAASPEWLARRRSLRLLEARKAVRSARPAHDVASTFELVYWRSLRNAPTPGEWLAGAIRFLAPEESGASDGEAAQTLRLLELLGEARCLLVLDVFETVLEPGDGARAFLSGYEGYGTLLRQIAEAPHQSCLILTSREEPTDLRPLRGESGPVSPSHGARRGRGASAPAGQAARR